MKGKMKFIGSFATLILATLSYMPAMAEETTDPCSCMCIDGAPNWVCTTSGFGNPPEPASCRNMTCPTILGDPGEDEAPGDEVGAVEPPANGLVCTRRSVYRPDLGHYKRYNVCKPALSAEQLVYLAHLRATWQEKLAATRARRHSNSSRSDWRSNRGRGRGHGSHDSDDDDDDS